MQHLKHEKAIKAICIEMIYFSVQMLGLSQPRTWGGCPVLYVALHSLAHDSPSCSVEPMSHGAQPDTTEACVTPGQVLNGTQNQSSLFALQS